MTAGDLTPSMIGKTKVSLVYEEARIEGLLTDLTVHTNPVRLDSKQQSNLLTRYEVTLSIQVGLIQVKWISLDHEVRIIS